MTPSTLAAGDTRIRNARILGTESRLQDIEIRAGVITAIVDSIPAAPSENDVDVDGMLVSPGLIETHIHLDKALIADRCSSQRGDLSEALTEVAKAKKDFTAEDVAARARRVLDMSLRNGVTHMRTHLEVDPVIGLRSLDGILPLIEDYAWALDLDVCVFPQEGLLNNPGTDELMVEALRRGARVVGGAPYTDTDPRGQMDRVFEMALEFDVDIDMHFDFGEDPSSLDLFYLCELTQRHGYEGRVTIGHVTKLAAADPELFLRAARTLADAGVAVTVLPSTDLYLMGRDREMSKTRGVVEAHQLLREGVNCSLSTNNVLNPFTPLGDGSLLRMANLYANVAHVGSDADFRECFRMISTRSARLLNLGSGEVAVGTSADLVVIDAQDARQAVCEIAPVRRVFKRGMQTVTSTPAVIHRPLP